MLKLAWGATAVGRLRFGKPLGRSKAHELSVGRVKHFGAARRHIRTFERLDALKQQRIADNAAISLKLDR